MIVTKKLPRIENFNYNKHLPKSFSDKTSDLFFVLMALYLASIKEKGITKLILEKALYKTSRSLAQDKNLTFFNTYFYVNTFGPHNNIFYKYLEELQNANLIDPEGNDIYLTPKGLSTITELFEDIKNNEKIKEVLSLLKKYVDDYVENSNKAINDTHNEEVLDTNGDIKTIKQLIKEIKPEQCFTSSAQFKYINPVTEPEVEKVSVPSTVINKLENVLSNVDEGDFNKEADLNILFQ